MIGVSSDFTAWPVQSESLRQLHQMMQSGQIPHAILLTGNPAPTHVFSTFLAKLLLCQSDDTAPCGECDSCRQFDAQTHPDYHPVDPDGGSVKTAQIENLQSALKLASHTGGRLVYTIFDVDTATPAAANRLLKTLEEPTSQVVAILTTRSRIRVLPTILSRCFVYRVDETADDGGLADGTLEQEDSGFAGLFGRVVKWSEELLTGHEPPILLAERFLGQEFSTDVGKALDVLCVWFRDAMHASAGDDHTMSPIEWQSDLQKQASKAAPEQWAEAVELVLSAKTRLLAHVASALNVEQMCIRLRGVLYAVHSRRRPF